MQQAEALRRWAAQQRLDKQAEEQTSPCRARLHTVVAEPAVEEVAGDVCCAADAAAELERAAAVMHGIEEAVLAVAVLRNLPSLQHLQRDALRKQEAHAADIRTKS